MSPSLDRRLFLHQLSATAAASTLLSQLSLAEQPQPSVPTADAFIAGKNRDLIVHNAKVGEIETPLSLLRDKPITPKELLFVRNNQVLPQTLSIEPASIEGWELQITGLIDGPGKINTAELQTLPQEQYKLVLQCSGNGRSQFSKTARAEGAQWHHGAMGNVTFKGVRLKVLLDHFGIQPKPDATFVAAEGKDSPEKAQAADFEHSIPITDAIERSILALSMNDEPLPKVHGGPLRLVTPGFYATMNIKWLSRLRFEREESGNYHHAVRYRTPSKPIVPGSSFTASLANSEPNWNMRIKSVIFAPLDSEQLSAGGVEIRGVAWNDGMTKIEAVELSIDQGQSWRRADLQRPASSYAWHHWSLNLDLPHGSQTILSRAIDESGRAQPLGGSVFWNPAGYAWNGVDSVTVSVG